MKYYIVLLFLMLVSCTTPKYIEVPVENTKIEYRDRLLYDSIYVKDSTDTHIRNDTVFKTVYKYLNKTRIEKDTINVTDTISKVVQVEVIKEVNKIKTWQCGLMILGGVSIAFILYKIKKLII